MNDDKSFKTFKSKLHYQLQLARKQAEAIDFVIRAKGDLEQVREEIRTREEVNNARKNDPSYDVFTLEDEELEHAYIKQLQESLDFVRVEHQKMGGYTEQLAGILHKSATPYDAIGDAIQFVLDADFDIELINGEIKETEDFINDPPDSLIGALHPDSSPGIYKRSYLKTLREVIEQIKAIDRHKN